MYKWEINWTYMSLKQKEYGVSYNFIDFFT